MNSFANKTSGFTAAELRKFRSLKDPRGVQAFLSAMPYHLADTAWSPRRVLHERTAHCYEGAMFAAAALRVLGFPPLIFDLEAEHDTDHVIAIYRQHGHWGAVAKSNFTSCRGREPIYRSLREQALSYFNTYCNLRQERTLRRFSQPVNLKRFDHLHWMTSDKPVWIVAEYLLDIPHTPLLKPGMASRLARLDDRSFDAECLGRATK